MVLSPQAIVSITIGSRLAAQPQGMWGCDGEWWRWFTMTGQNVQNNTGGMNTVRKRLGTGSFHGLQPVSQNSCEDIDHLPIAIRLAFQLALYPPQGWR
jgi:hypothetical protein